MAEFHGRLALPPPPSSRRGLPVFTSPSLLAAINSELSRDDRRPEESLLVWGIDRDSAADLGAEFGQFAVVFGEAGGPAELLPCLPWS